MIGTHRLSFTIQTGILAIFAVFFSSCFPNMFLSFDGVDDYILVGDLPEIDFDQDDAFTIEIWVKCTDNGKTMALVSNLVDITVNPMGYELGIDGSEIFFIISQSPVSFIIAVIADDGLNICDGTWHHIASSYDGSCEESGVSIYIDGISQVLSTSSGISCGGDIPDNGPLQIGAGCIVPAGPERPYEGVMDEVRIWNVERTSTEIAESMNTVVPSNHPDLALYYRFNDGPLCDLNLLPAELQEAYENIQGETVLIKGMMMAAGLPPAALPMNYDIARDETLNDYDGTLTNFGFTEECNSNWICSTFFDEFNSCDCELDLCCYTLSLGCFIEGYEFSFCPLGYGYIDCFFALEYGCLELGSDPVIKSFELFNAPNCPVNITQSVSQALEFDMTELECPFNVTLPMSLPLSAEAFPLNVTSSECEITILDIILLSGSDDGNLPSTLMDPMDSYFELLTPTEFPVNISVAAPVDVSISFDPQTLGTHSAWAYICFENNCACPPFPSGIPELQLIPVEMQNGFPCNSTYYFTFPVEACVYGADLTDVLGDDPNASDPCSCEDALNVIDHVDYSIIYFHDVIRVESDPGEDWRIISSANPLYRDDSMTPVNEGVWPTGEAFMETSAGVYELEIWHAPGGAGQVDVILNREDNAVTNIHMVGDLCLDDCHRIPAAGTWGLILLGLIMVILGTVALSSNTRSVPN